MWATKENGNYIRLSLLFQNLFLFLSCQFFYVWAQCEHGLESTCVWMHHPQTTLLWQMKRTSEEFYVELTKCTHPNCGTAIIQGPWLPPRDKAVTTTIQYKIYGTSAVYFRLNLNVDDTLTPTQLFSKESSYSYGWPETWTSATVTLPPTHTKYQLLLKANIPYSSAMVAIKDISLDGTVIPTTSTTTTTAKPPEEEERIENEVDYVPEEEDYDEEETQVAGWQPMSDNSPTLTFLSAQVTIIIMFAGLLIQRLSGCVYCAC